ncbi:MAG TPA: DinB family protein [Candidatus Dormibacteraeota bacterium]|nr:DinB family protein [Candidatus Dormibacteraeota bacterium]
MTPAEVATLLEISGRAFADLLKSLPEEVATWKPEPAEWCVNECVGHIIEAEKRGFAGRIRSILREDEPTFERWDQPAVAAARRDCAKPPSALLDEFEPLRHESLELIRSLGDAQLDRGGIHPAVGLLTVRDLLHEWVHHDGNHLRQAYANVQAYVWPDMGNAQRFSKP